MITYKELFEGLKRSGLDGQRKLLVIDPKHRVRATQMIQILCHAEIAVWNKSTATYALHPKQVKLSIIVVDIPKNADLGRVHVDWSGCGHSSGSYRVLADKGKYLEIAFDLDKSHTMTVSKERVKAA